MIINHQAANLTAVISGNARVVDVQNYLSKFDQFIPIGSFHDETTIAQVVNHNLIGELSDHFGTIKKWLLNLKIGNANEDFHTGANIMKNVSGYDLTRMMIGSKGKFGEVLESTFKLMPLKYLFDTKLPIRNGCRLIMMPSLISKHSTIIGNLSMNSITYANLGVIDIEGNFDNIKLKLANNLEGNEIKMITIHEGIPWIEYMENSHLIEQISTILMNNKK
ncbi:MAG: FAD-binding oxidoreductase [Candidatus Marinimicrobia bacterium]|jgi:hypothetical protein|nr:FAD-binding oxidoreductase [Candidatus Neomarinimicrobiota bacterium]MBT3632846.1 FAD-binding oxidoreductase [Candidatus Neomarinimicrobiota bacterium]MBT3681956.1 FAD-binding oxidoreductase [Candidatus Neomarinimicrobiota bacterium]MBT3759015.1 FAD-binding oxidoreductase [Candidatus Neomarinimicrobiota bacterium]MBT3895086.1 FAD-binding oxidoreductase [Candidatus Neomarinimicrobiota bacterium]